MHHRFIRKTTELPRGGWITLGVLIAIHFLALSGCQKSDESQAKRQLVGNWKLSAPEKLADRMNKGEKGAPTQTRFEGAGLGILVKFQKSQKLTTSTKMMGETVEKTGTWKVISTERHQGELRFADIEFALEEDEPQQIRITFTSDGKIRMAPPNIAILEKQYDFEKQP